MRITLQDFALSRAPQVLGLCSDNLPGIASYVNEAIQRLLMSATEDGWWQGWDRITFNVNRDNPYITLPSRYARLIGLDTCRIPMPIATEWFEFLEAGIGLQTTCTAKNGCGMKAVFSRGTVTTITDLTATNQYIRVYYTDVRDVGQQITFYNALDQNSVNIYSQNGLVPVNGFFLTLQAPFATTAFIVTKFQSISKPVTYGDVVVKQVDATTGTEVLLARILATEKSPTYVRYLITGLPPNCCDPNTSTVQLTAMAKLDFYPVANPTDQLLIGNIPALKLECESIRFSEMDVANAAELSALKHRQAVNLLNKELQHYGGSESLSVNVAPFGTARLERVNLAMT